jgi:ketosteroid isomerase-like protein
MSKAKNQVAIIGGSADELEATFYEALQTADLEKLMACWADEDDVVCIHPGGPRLVGINFIRAAFDEMFSNGSIRVWPEHIRKVESMTSSVHSVRERIEVLTEGGMREAHVIATNVYHKTAQGWRLVAHHASQGSGHDLLETTDPPQVLH